MQPNQDITFIMHGCEFVDCELIANILELQKQFKVVGIGVYSDTYFQKLFGRLPIKPYEERSRLASAIKGVAFAFPVDEDFDKEHLIADEPVYTKSNESNPYRIIYAPGTYDLFHEGHLQHLLEVRSLCDILVVGVNSDDLVYKNKKKHPTLSENDRMTVVRNLKFVDYVYLVESNDKRIANRWVTETTGYPISAIFMGSDLKGSLLEENPDGIPVLFTQRDPIIMAKRSTTYYREMLEKFQ